MADEKLQIDITAKDDASKVIDPLAKKVDQLEKADAEISVTADADKADNEVDAFAKKLNKLGDADQVVVLALRAGAAQTELAEISADLAKIDASDPDVDVKIARYAEVAGQLDDLETKMKGIADTSLDPDVGDKARSRLQGIGEEAGKTQGAVHSMAGNALGDFAATTSGIGPLGEAIGQLTETALEGEVGIKGLATAGLGIGALSAGMFLVNKVMGEFAKTAERAAEIKAFNTQDVDAFTKALTSGKDAAADYVDRMEALGKVTTVAATRISDFAGPLLESTKDIAPALAAAGITMDQFAKAVTGGEDDLSRFNAAVKASGVSTDEANLIISGAATEAENYGKAQENAARFTKVFGDNVDHTGDQVKLFTNATQDMRNKLVGADTATDGLADSLGKAVGKTNDLTGAYQKLSDQIANDQAMIDLEDQIAAVTEAGNAAITAQKEANEAINKNASDATAKQREAEAAMRDFRTQVNQAKDDVIRMAQTFNATPLELDTALKKIDQGDLAGAKADAEAWSRRNPIQLTGSIGTILGAGLGKAGGTATIQTTSTVNQFLAAPDARRQARDMARTARVNGR